LTGAILRWVVFGRAEYPQRKYRALGATAVSVLGEKMKRLIADQMHAALDDDHAFTLG
jgi:hypothetical protein